ncbi:putative monooxygenase-2 [Coleophoma crateriformis]|uniref:Putative monooxygenase-2 n=1 Tax=Coleophoma crateriformis TaxID=565419 RepID=A0A3D8QEF2_9HELO|nr:putative monooxygenase-2 [Coleophoma crateriformis]
MATETPTTPIPAAAAVETQTPTPVETTSEAITAPPAKADVPKKKKMIHLCFFDTCCAGNHMNAGQWKREGDSTKDKDKLPYWLWMAKLAEKGKITCIFLADTYGGHEVYTGSMAPVLRGGTQAGFIDPFMVVSAMAGVTNNVSIAVTGSTSYIPPNINARAFSSLDHLSNGRIGWNIVTSFSKSAARAFGQKDVLSHDERYDMAEEYMQLMYKMWNGSWADDAKVWDTVNNMAYNPEKTRKFKHEGKYFAFEGRHQSSPSPQRTPFLFQAGTSKSGMRFAARHAEGIYTGGIKPEGTKDGIAAIRAQAAAMGRDPSTIKAFIGLSPVLGRTLEEAQAKFDLAVKHADAHAGLAQFCGYSGLDLSKFPFDEPLDVGKMEESGNAIHTIIRALNEGDTSGLPWTPKRIGMFQALGGFHPMPVGTPEMVADELETWIDIADVDGFNIAYVSNPGSFEDVVELLVPELQKRGLMQTEYAVPGGTMRENLLRQPGQKKLRDDHFGSQFSWENWTPSGEEVVDSIKAENATAVKTGPKMDATEEKQPTETVLPVQSTSETTVGA